MFVKPMACSSAGRSFWQSVQHWLRSIRHLAKGWFTGRHGSRLWRYFWCLGIAYGQVCMAPVPFFQPPSSLLEVYLDDWPRLLDSLYNSFKLLASGFVLGAIAGFLTGVSIGWVQAIGYWVHPVLRFLGPIPSTALLPMAFYFFPSGFSAAVFLIALATWFPLTVLTWSGVASVDKAYYDVARTLGASQLFLILRVAIPAALPHVLSVFSWGWVHLSRCWSPLK